MRLTMLLVGSLLAGSQVVAAVPSQPPLLPAAARASVVGAPLASSAATAPTTGTTTAETPPEVEVRTVDVSLTAPLGLAARGRSTADAVVAEPGADARLVTPVIDAGGAQTLGVTWAHGADGAALGPQVRSRTGDVWSDWVPLDAGATPDAGSPDARAELRGGTEPLWLGTADAVQLSFAATAGTATAAATTAGTAPAPGVQVALIESPQVKASATTSSRQAGSRRIIPRSEWGAPAQVCQPDVADALKGAVVHHTAGSNAYSNVAEAMQALRNDAVYHINTRGWCDLGYNFVVDKWGNIYEGRARSLELPVVGVHAGGFNTGFVGVSMLGTYDAAPPPAVQEAVGYIIGMRLGQFGLDPRDIVPFYTAGGENSRFANQTVTLPRVFGHRDVAYTACPGNGGQAALPLIRDIAYHVASTVVKSNLVRHVPGGTVYVVTSSAKYPVVDNDTVEMLSALGPVGYASQAYLDSLPNGGWLNRLVQGRDGTVYLVDGVNRYPFASCDMVAQWGYACSQARVLDDAQVAKFYPGPTMTTAVRTPTGRYYSIDSGTKHEAADVAALTAAGLPPAPIVVTDRGLRHLPFGVPVLRDDVVVRSRSTGTSYLVTSRTLQPLAPGTYETTPLGSLPTGWLEEPSVQAATRASDPPLAVFAKAPTGSVVWLLNGSTKSQVTDAAATGTVTRIPQSHLDRFTTLPSTPAPVLVKSPASSAVYRMDKGVRRSIPSWDDALRLTAASGGPRISTIDTRVVNSLPTGPDQLGPGSLAYSPSSASVYLIDGYATKHYIGSWARMANLGTGPLNLRKDTDLAAYTTAPGFPQNVVVCAQTRYLASGGRLYPVAAAAATHWSTIAATTLDPTTCATLTRSSTTVGRFLRLPTGAIWYVENGVRRNITSYARYLQLGGNDRDWVPVDQDAIATIPTGTDI